MMPIIITAHIRNKNTREAYARAVSHFFGWCEARTLYLDTIHPVAVAAYIVGGWLADKPRGLLDTLAVSVGAGGPSVTLAAVLGLVALSSFGSKFHANALKPCVPSALVHRFDARS